MDEVLRNRVELLRQLADEYGHSSASGASEVAMLLGRAVKLMVAIDSGEPVALSHMPNPDENTVSDVRAG